MLAELPRYNQSAADGPVVAASCCFAKSKCLLARLSVLGRVQVAAQAPVNSQCRACYSVDVIRNNVTLAVVVHA